MEKTKGSTKLTRLMSLLLVFAMLAGMVSIPTAAADEYNASFIQQLNNLAVDYTSYLDSSKVFKLPEGVSADEEISVIITVDGASVMDAYNGTDKTMSFSEYAQTGDNTAAVKQSVSEKKADVLAALDKKNISYTTGEEYSAVIAGFELIIKAGDFEAITALTREAVRTMLGFEFLHLGMNNENEEEARKGATLLSSLFGGALKEGEKGIFVGESFEVMKSMGRGTKGHIAIRTNFLDRAVAYFERMGVEFDKDTVTYFDDGRPKFIYFKEEICGFAIHLIEK